MDWSRYFVQYFLQEIPFKWIIYIEMEDLAVCPTSPSPQPNADDNLLTYNE